VIESAQDAGALSGRVALVTGAARGIGEAITRLLAARGAAVVLADRDGDLACSVADDLAAHGADILGLAVDITSEQAVAELAAVIGSRWGRLDVLVNNAAILYATPLEKLTRDRFGEVQRINQDGALSRSGFCPCFAAPLEDASSTLPRSSVYEALLTPSPMRPQREASSI
jgi:NAD(P)-dependent dehydrogenase (short-subunit alcohol dehydrogenase family)